MLPAARGVRPPNWKIECAVGLKSVFGPIEVPQYDLSRTALHTTLRQLACRYAMLAGREIVQANLRKGKRSPLLEIYTDYGDVTPDTRPKRIHISCTCGDATAIARLDFPEKP